MAYPGAGRPLKAQQQNQNQQFYPPPSSYANGYQNQMPPIPYQNGLSNHYQPPPGPPPPNNPIQQPAYNNVQWEAPPPNYFQQNPGLVSPCNGRKKALLIGINYRGTSAELKGCINDVYNLKQYLTQDRRWPDDPNSIVILTDDSPNPVFQPTKQNIIEAMRWLASCNNYGDSLFLHYSGHGGQKQDASGDESDGMDETIMPLDYQRAGVITDDDMNRMLVKPLPPGVRLTAIFDCCHSGSSLDLPFMYHPDGSLKSTSKASKLGNAAISTATKLFSGNIFGAISSVSKGINALGSKEKSIQQKEQEKGNQYADVIMFSGCQDAQTSADSFIGGQATGAMSHALIKALRQFPQCSYGQLLLNIRTILQNDYHQKPQMSTGRFLDMNQMFNI